MGYIDTSVAISRTSTTGISVGGNPDDLIIAGQRFSPLTTGSYKTPEEAAAAGIAAQRGTTTTGAKPSALANVLGTLEGLETKASRYIDSGIKSSIGTFSKAANGLSSEFDKQLAGIFKDTNKKSASTVSTAVSDPISSTLLGDKKAGATSFKVGGLIAGSQADSKSSATVGTGAAQMTGARLSTLLNRLSVDVAKVKTIGNVAASKFSTQSINKLFSDLTLKAGSSLGNQQSIIGIKSVVSPVAGSQKSIQSILGIGTGATITNSVANSVRSFLGRASPASDALGGSVDLSSFYQPNLDFSITKGDRTPVYTGKSGVDATTANSILSLLREAGCGVNTQEYLSSTDTDSLFGLGLILAALFGIKDLVDDILNCSHTSTVAGQLSLSRAFGEVAGSQPDIAKSILDNMDNPAKANDFDINKSILENANLSVTNKSTVDSIFTTMGTSTKEVMAIGSVSSPSYPVYDGSLIPTIQPSFTNAVFADTTLSDYFKGKQLVLGTDGVMRYG